MTVFEWSDSKDRSNRSKHAVSFELARRVFDDPNALMVQDRVERGEERWQAIGRAGPHAVLVVAHVVRQEWPYEVVRIVSARRALPYERQRYESEAFQE